jgi:Alpha-L-rhamnosidase N-terminal domain.
MRKRLLKKIIALTALLAVVIVMIVAAVMYLPKYVFKHAKNYPDDLDYAVSPMLAENIKSDWDAEWIWTKKSEKNTYVAFRYPFTLDKLPETAVASIAVDGKYKLYINGELAVVDGGLKRGPTSTGTYYENVDIKNFLKTGENIIAALVDYFGEDGFSHNDSGHGGFLFEADLGDMKIKSGAGWKAKKIENYEKNFFVAISSPNYRLPESRVIYNALGEENFTDNAYDDSLWKNAVSFGEGGSAPWNDLHRRVTPAFRDNGIKSFVNSAEYEGTTTKKR